MIDLYELTQNELIDLLTGWGEPKFRARQVWKWLYQKRVDNFDAMSNLPAKLRERLKVEARLGALALEAEQVSRDGTIKRLYRLDD
ncbi:MAG TPA: 23S rRNA (adenine(2503)-C(2))-methyltransferase RlmN, partial [Spirillospora sp.]|nr:23S rRNA (adenine(2503)-C(2))-methyltransferase RlmN [Spirillospora sp.]